MGDVIVTYKPYPSLYSTPIKKPCSPGGNNALALHSTLGARHHVLSTTGAVKTGLLAAFFQTL